MNQYSHSALVDLIRWNSHLQSLTESARREDYSGGPSVTLDRSAVIEILDRCISGDLNIEELPEWAGAVHMMDNIDLKEEDVDVLTQFLFEVSSPEIVRPVTEYVCSVWLSRLKTVP